MVPDAPLKEIVYLTVTEHEVTAVEDPALREIALGGPDTSARTRLVHRVRRAPAHGKECDDSLREALSKRAPGLTLDTDTMRLESGARLRVDHEPPPGGTSECDPIASAGYLGDENQLIRVHVTRERNCLWGYDNASFLYRATLHTDGTTLVLQGTHVDEVHVPAPQQWVEVLSVAANLDPETSISALAGLGREIAAFDPETNTITLKVPVPKPAEDISVYVRMWESSFDFIGDGTTPTALVTRDGHKNGVRVYTRGPAVPGDYWMIGVRPSKPDKFYPGRLVTDQPPDGPARWATPLAMIAWNNDGKTALVHDCRRPFDSLTEDDDLAFHNQHLHGWGVVCGLQVRCMTQDIADEYKLEKPREWVTLANGYAIDPTGVDIRLRARQGFTPIQLADLAVRDGALKRNSDGTVADGSVSLWIDKHRNLHVDAYQPKPSTDWLWLLEDTLLGDIYKDCVLRVLEYLKDEILPGTSTGRLSAARAFTAAWVTGDLTGGAADGLISEQGRRFTALFNLLWQLVNQKNGRHIYLSGDPAAPNSLATEDGILRTFFHGLKELLQSKSFCAMFEDVDYPKYDVYRPGVGANTAKPTTIFGTGRHTRIRIHPKLPFAFTCGVGRRIHVYELDKHKMIAAIDYPVADAVVQDVAFGPGKEIYAIAWIGAAQAESSFAVGFIGANGGIEWSGTEVTCALKLVTLATLRAEPKRVFASARGRGVYAFSAGAPSAPPELVGEHFRATGQLVGVSADDKRSVLFAGENEDDANGVSFTQIRMFDPDKPSSTRVFRIPDLGSQGEGLGEDIAVRQTNTAKIDELYAVADGPSGTKRLIVWDPAKQEPRDIIDLGQSAGCRIAFSLGARWGLVTYIDSYLGRAYDPEKRALDTQSFHPLQVGPCSIASDPRGEWFYVLEFLSNTITAIPAMQTGNLPTRAVVDAAKLEAYRVAALRAYLKLIRRFVQYLKDCACDHALVNCPDPKGNKVYLADISFKNGAVYQICNFHHRKYVHTFPTVEYWLSIVPVIPWLKHKVEELCCSVMSGLFGNSDPPDDAKDAKDDRISVNLWLNGQTYWKALNVRSMLHGQLFQLYRGYGLGKAALVQKLMKPSPGNADKPIASISLTDEAAETVTKVAAEKGLTVVGQRLVDNPFKAAWKLGKSPSVLAPGDAIELVTDNKGTVLAVMKVERPSQIEVSDEGPEELVKVKRELETLKKRHAEQLAAVREEMKSEMLKLRKLISPSPDT